MSNLKFFQRTSNSFRFGIFAFFFLLLGVVFATHLPNTVKSESGNLNQTETHETDTKHTSNNSLKTFLKLPDEFLENYANNENLFLQIPRNEKTEIPQKKLWEMVFRMNSFLEKESQKMIENGKDDELFSNYFKVRGKLTDEQASILKEKSVSYLNEIQPLDIQAEEIIKEVWSNVTKDNLSDPNKFPEPPEKLKELQNKNMKSLYVTVIPLTILFP